MFEFEEVKDSIFDSISGKFVAGAFVVVAALGGGIWYMLSPAKSNQQNQIVSPVTPSETKVTRNSLQTQNAEQLEKKTSKIIIRIFDKNQETDYESNEDNDQVIGEATKEARFYVLINKQLIDERELRYYASRVADYGYVLRVLSEEFDNNPESVMRNPDYMRTHPDDIHLRGIIKLIDDENEYYKLEIRGFAGDPQSVIEIIDIFKHAVENLDVMNGYADWQDHMFLTGRLFSEAMKEMLPEKVELLSAEQWAAIDSTVRSSVYTNDDFWFQKHIFSNLHAVLPLSLFHYMPYFTIEQQEQIKQHNKVFFESVYNTFSQVFQEYILIGQAKNALRGAPTKDFYTHIKNWVRSIQLSELLKNSLLATHEIPKKITLSPELVRALIAQGNESSQRIALEIDIDIETLKMFVENNQLERGEAVECCSLKKSCSIVRINQFLQHVSERLFWSAETRESRRQIFMKNRACCIEDMDSFMSIHSYDRYAEIIGVEADKCKNEYAVISEILEHIKS